MLEVSTLGKFSVVGGDAVLNDDILRSDMLKKLLIYILTHREHPITIQELAEALWQDEETDNPPDIVDLDDNEVPLANDLFNKGREILADGVLLFGGLPIQAKAGIIATVLVAAIIGTWYVKSCKKRKKQYEKQTKQKMDSPSV